MIYKVSEKLPDNNQYVLAHFPDRPWHSDHAPNNEHKWEVVQFRQGLSIAERELLKDSDSRKREYRTADQDGNNRVPYCWQPFGPGSFFGQEAVCWCYLPVFVKDKQ